jgi:hypothetical protein
VSGPQGRDSAAARPAEDASGRVQLRGMGLHVIEGERGPGRPGEDCCEGSEGECRSRGRAAVLYRC